MASGKKGAVGIVGLGIMGGAFAKNLVEDGWQVFGYDLDAGQRKALAIAVRNNKTDQRFSGLLNRLQNP